jgi:hypothetical protein
MRKFFYLLLLFIGSNSLRGQAYPDADHPVYAEGYYRSNGAYVQPYYRALPGHENSHKSNAIHRKSIPSTAPSIGKPVPMKGYYRSDGTHVQPHYRALPKRDGR